MSLPDENLSLASFVQEEMLDTLSRRLSEMLSQLPPAARLRLLAFMHLAENPETMKASLQFETTGSMRLVLDTFVSPARAQQH
jgi:hypothetical protein